MAAALVEIWLAMVAYIVRLFQMVNLIVAARMGWANRNQIWIKVLVVGWLVSLIAMMLMMMAMRALTSADHDSCTHFHTTNLMDRSHQMHAAKLIRIQMN